MGELRTVVMRAVEMRATAENATQCEELEEAGLVSRGPNASEEALRVVAVKKLGDMRLRQVTLDVKKPSAAARRALFLEAMAEGGNSYTAEPGSPRKWRMGPGQHTKADCEATGGAAGSVLSKATGPGRARGEGRAWLNQMLARVYLQWADVVLLHMSSAHPVAPESVVIGWLAPSVGNLPTMIMDDDRGSRNGRARGAGTATAPRQSACLLPGRCDLCDLSDLFCGVTFVLDSRFEQGRLDPAHGSISQQSSGAGTDQPRMMWT